MYTLSLRPEATRPDTQVIVGIAWAGALPRTDAERESVYATLASVYRALSTVLPPAGGSVDVASQIIYEARTGARGLSDADVRRALYTGVPSESSGPAVRTPDVRVSIRAGAEDSTLREIVESATRPARAVADAARETATRGAREVLTRAEDAADRAAEVVETGLEAGGRAALALTATQIVLGVIAIGVLYFLWRRGVV